VTKKRPQPPEWFTEKDYGYLQGRDAYGWCREFQRCSYLLDEANKHERHNAWEQAGGKPPEFIGPRLIGLELPEPERLLAEEMGDILGVELESGMVRGGITLPPTMRVDDKVFEKHFAHWPTIALKVNLDWPDADILADFARKLGRLRKKQPLPLQKPGVKPSAMRDIRYGCREFDLWITRKIVPLVDLLHWRAMRHVKVNDATIGEWLFGGRDQPSKEMAKARRTLGRALRAVHKLAAQAAAEAHHNQGPRPSR
jgi:hypothetical protein